MSGIRARLARASAPTKFHNDNDSDEHDEEEEEESEEEHDQDEEDDEDEEDDYEEESKESSSSRHNARRRSPISMKKTPTKKMKRSTPSLSSTPTSASTVTPSPKPPTVIDLMDVDDMEEEDEPIQYQKIPAAKVSQLQSMLGVSSARCKELLLGSDLDVDRAVNLYFDSQEQKQPSASKKPLSTAVSAVLASLPPMPKMTPIKKSPSKSLLSSKKSLLSSKSPTPSKSASSPYDAFPTPSSVRKPVRAPARRSSFNQPKKKKAKKVSDDEDDDDDDSEFNQSDNSDDSGAMNNNSDDDDDDDDDGGFRPAGDFFRRRAPFGRRPRTGRDQADDLIRQYRAEAEAGAAVAAAAAMIGGRRRRGGGVGRRGANGRAALLAAKAEASRIITPEVIAQQPEDTDEERLAQVQTWNAPPRPIDVMAAGLNFPEKYQSRARWKVGMLVDCKLDDERGWEKAKIMNIVSAPRSFALSYEVSFEDRRVDVLPGALFRFSAMDLTHLDKVDVIYNVPRWEIDDSEKDRLLERQKKKKKSSEDEEKWKISDFKQRQLIDVKVGKRWFLGMVTDSKFTMIGDQYADVLDVHLLDFHHDCARRYATPQLNQLHPIAYSHPITHYPLAALPAIRDKEFDITSVYASHEPDWNWSSEAAGVPVNEDEDGEKEEEKKDEEELALNASPDPAPSEAAAASAAASSSSSAANRRPAAAAGVPSAFKVPARPLGRFELTIVTDADYNVNSKAAHPYLRPLLDRAIVCRSDDPMCTKLNGRPITRDVSLKRLKALLEFSNLAQHLYVNRTYKAQLIQISQPEDEDAEPVRPTAGVRLSSKSLKQSLLEDKYRRIIQEELWSNSVPSMTIAKRPDEVKNLRLKSIQTKLKAHEKKLSEAVRQAIANKVIQSDDFESIEQIQVSDEDDEPKAKKEAKPASASAAASSASSSSDWSTPSKESSNEVKEVSDRWSSAKKKHKEISLVDEHGSLRWYRISVEFSLIRSPAKDPKRTSQEVSPLSELMLLLFPDSDELKRLTYESLKEMPPYLPNSLTLDGLLKHSAHYHHTLAEREHHQQEEERKNGMDEEKKGEEQDPLKMDAAELSRAAQLVPTCTLKDYQVQTVHWMLKGEERGHNLSESFWVTLNLEDGTKFQYSPLLQRFTFSPHPNICGGWICEEMGLGKTIEMLAVLNLKANDDRASAEEEAQTALAASRGVPVASLPPLAPNARLPVVRDAHGAFVTRATLIICPVSLISQWIAELREKSARPLKILSYHGTRTKDPKDLLDYDIVITAYSILSKESTTVSQRSKHAALYEPWNYHGKAGLQYTSPLGQVHWRRIVLDEGHSVKNASAECSQLSHKLLGRCRYLMSGTPFGTSLMDIKGQARFLGLTGFSGTILFNSLYRFLQSQPRYIELAKKLRPDDWDGIPYRVHEWLKRFRNIFTHLVTHCMMRHEKSMVFRGRDTLLELPAAKIEVVRVELTPNQRAAYKLLFEFASKRFAQFKESGDAVRKTIEVLQLLVPLRQACSVGTVDIDSIKRQLKDIARGIAIGAPLGGASAASAAFPQATVYAFGTLADECTICLDLLEDAVQTSCNHLFCKECVLSLTEARGADSVCPNCRSRISAATLYAPMIRESDEEREKREAKEAQDAEEAEKKKDEGEDEDVEMKAADPEDEPILPKSPDKKKSSAKKKPSKKRKRKDSDEDEEEDADDKDEEDEGDGDQNESKEELAEDLHGEIVFDSKLKALMAELRAMKEADPTAKALVFTQFRTSMDKIQEALTTEGINFQMLLGHYTLQQRRKALDKFRTDPDTTVFLLSVRAAAAGLTLTSANYVFIVEPGFNPAITLQAINRVWRMGQQKQVNVRYMVCSDTVEETILVIAREKMAKRGASGADAEDHSGGSNLSLLPELKDSAAAASGLAAAATAAANAAAAAAAPPPPRPPSPVFDPLDARAEAQRLRGRIGGGFGGRRWGRGRGGEDQPGAEREDRGLVMGHAVNDAPDIRLGELERLFQV